ncbi:hypothetical protein ACFY1L_06910 [Streptomyces sp. NPDC001663]|uniref:hypothetical protein n=1 Tax=Streptomyces sp. NPDC001663 TaxID=3364597 RepID=UPI0036B50EA5
MVRSWPRERLWKKTWACRLQPGQETAVLAMYIWPLSQISSFDEGGARQLLQQVGEVGGTTSVEPVDEGGLLVPPRR